MDTNWIQNLIEEEKTHSSGHVRPVKSSSKEALSRNSLKFLTVTKESFLNLAYAYNQARNSEAGQVKVYNISKTQADFMIFRNGFRLIFTLKGPGHIDVLSSRPATLSGENKLVLEKNLLAQLGAFDEISWTCENKAFKVESMVKYYLKNFIQASNSL